MSIYFCAVCDQQKDNDYIHCREWDQGFICQECLDRIESTELWELMRDFNLIMGKSQEHAETQATSYMRTKWRMLGGV